MLGNGDFLEFRDPQGFQQSWWKKVKWDVKLKLSSPQIGLSHWWIEVQGLPKAQISRLGLWSPTQTRGADYTLGRSHHQFDWAMESQSQWPTSWMHWLALIQIGICSDWSMLIIRQPNTYMTSSCKVGFVDTPALYNVYMTREASSLDRTFNGYWKSLALRMYAQPAKIHNLMQSVKECIRQEIMC